MDTKDQTKDGADHPATTGAQSPGLPAEEQAPAESTEQYLREWPNQKVVTHLEIKKEEHT